MNPVIARFFKEVGLADELGSGVRRLYQYCKAWCGHDPEMVEDDVFRLILLTSRDSDSSQGSGTGEGLVEGLVGGLVESQRKMLGLIKRTPHISKREMAEMIGISTTAVDKNITSLKAKGLLRRVGSARTGHWEVIE